MNLLFYRRLIHIRGLITVPGAIALAIWLFSVPMLAADHVYRHQLQRLFDIAGTLDIETARAVLTTIAAAAITTLSLVYSLVLIVFTLAAGTIAPRLLKRFTTDRVNQVTAGLLGGTFLFALTVLYRTRPDFIPLASIAAAMLLAIIFVLQLIYFVHTVSRSVTIDEEIAAISGRLEKRISGIVREEEERPRKDGGPREFPGEVACSVSGYLNSVEERALLDLACKHDLTIRLLYRPGDFILQSQTVARLSRMPKDDKEEQAVARAIGECLLILPSRSAVDDIEYSIKLLIEIALRALSPGVNDTYTAIAALDALTAAFSDAVRDGLRRRDLVDDDGRLRVEMPGFSLQDMLDSAFHPLRRAAVGNMLMMLHIADALSRLHEIGNETARELISSHGALLLESARSSDPSDTDYAFLRQRLTFLEQGE